MRLIIGILFLLSALITNAQNNGEAYSIENEYNFYYKDSANGEFAYGDYEPTHILGLPDNSLIISTEFSISFPSQYKTPATYDSVYFQKQRIYREKSHVSSGSIFKLDNHFQKSWEIVFKDKRVCKIQHLGDNGIIAVGERVDMKKFWLAYLNLDGKILWEKEYKIQSQSFVSDVYVDDLGSIFVLTESENRIPVRIHKIQYGRKRLEFFKINDMKQNLHLFCISSSGKINWIKTLDNRKKFSSFGYKIIQGNGEIFVSSRYSGFKKINGKEERKEGKYLYEISKSGKIIQRTDFSNNYLLFYDNGVISCKEGNGDSINFYRNYDLIKSNFIPERLKNYWIISARNAGNDKYILGTFSNNLGYQFMEVNNEYLLKTIWTNNKNRSCEAVDFLRLSNGDIILVGKKWIKEDSKYIHFINVIKINKNGA